MDLIDDYLAAVERCLALFYERFQRRDLIRAWRGGAIPQRGDLVQNVRYRFHGVGCAVELSDCEVDFDFASELEVGFDAWRLWLHARQFPHRYPEYGDRIAVDRMLAACLSEGRVRKAPPSPSAWTNQDLFVLADASLGKREAVALDTQGG